MLGEYAAIDGGLSIIAPVRPPYRYELGESLAHPESPYGRYLREFGLSSAVQIRSVAQGPGSGLGSSTAELIAGAISHRGSAFDPEALLVWYQSRFPEASGGDLLVQAISGKFVGNLYQYSHRSKAKPFTASPSVLSRIQVFRVCESNKLRTHEDLRKNRPVLALERMNQWTERGVLALQGESEEGFLGFNEFAEYLSSLGLETARARVIRESFRRCSGVISAKGCGAGLNDVFLVVMDLSATAEELKLVRKTADQHGLQSMGSLGEVLW